MRDEATERGDEQSLPFVLFHLARTELLLGDWADAAAAAAACVRTTIDSGQQSERPFAAAINAVVRAHLGDVDLAEVRSRTGLISPSASVSAGGDGDARDSGLHRHLGGPLRGGRPHAAVAQIAADSGLLEPGLFRYHGDAIEAKIALGRLDEAAVLLSRTGARAEALDRPWLRLIVGRAAACWTPPRVGSTLPACALPDTGRTPPAQPFKRAHAARARIGASPQPAEAGRPRGDDTPPRRSSSVSGPDSGSNGRDRSWRVSVAGHPATSSLRPNARWLS